MFDRNTFRAVGARGGASRAFTLIEILCVVIILGIAGAIIVPELSTRSDLKASASARILMADLIYAQNRAITVQGTQVIAFDTTNQQYTLYATPGPIVLTHPVNHTPFVVKYGTGGSAGLTDLSMASISIKGASNASYTALAFDDLGSPLAYNLSNGASEPLKSATVTLRCGTYELAVNIEADTGQMTVAEVH